jgi:hypothetical protein
MAGEDGETAAEKFVRQMKVALRPDLIRDVPDEFFQPGQESHLRRRVMEVVDLRLVRDKVPIGRQLRVALLESIMADIERVAKERSG